MQAGREEVFELADQANRFSPELKPFDRYGMCTDQVSFHPAYHALHDLAVSKELPNFAWNNAGRGAHVAHATLNYMFNQVEGGVVCPMAMTYAAIPALKSSPAVAEEWLPKLLPTRYDRRDIPLSEKPAHK